MVWSEKEEWERSIKRVKGTEEGVTPVRLVKCNYSHPLLVFSFSLLTYSAAHHTFSVSNISSHTHTHTHSHHTLHLNFPIHLIYTCCCFCTSHLLLQRCHFCQVFFLLFIFFYSKVEIMYVLLIFLFFCLTNTSLLLFIFLLSQNANPGCRLNDLCMVSVELWFHCKGFIRMYLVSWWAMS